VSSGGAQQAPLSISAGALGLSLGLPTSAPGLPVMIENMHWMPVDDFLKMLAGGRH
jgi:hypothetical protein